MLTDTFTIGGTTTDSAETINFFKDYCEVLFDKTCFSKTLDEVVTLPIEYWKKPTFFLR